MSHAFNSVDKKGYGFFLYVQCVGEEGDAVEGVHFELHEFILKHLDLILKHAVFFICADSLLPLHHVWPTLCWIEGEFL